MEEVPAEEEPAAETAEEEAAEVPAEEVAEEAPVEEAPAEEPVAEEVAEEAPAEEPESDEITSEADVEKHLVHDVTSYQAHTAIEDTVAEQILNKHVVVEKASGKGKAVINIDTISAKFNEGDIVTLKALKDKKLVDSKAGRLKVLARGSIDKALTVRANDFSLDAVKMILLVGGHVEKIKNS